MNSSRLLCLILLCLSSTLYCQNNNDEKILQVAKELNSWDIHSIHIKRLSGGQTNDNYKVSSGPVAYFFRCSNESQAVLDCSLEREWQITNIVSSQGAAPQVIFYSPQNGILVTDFIETTGGKVNFRDKATMQRFCHVLSSVHNLKVLFPTEFCPFEAIQNYTQTAMKAGVTLPEAFTQTIRPKITTLQQIVSSTMQVTKRPAHLDLWAGNVLDDGKKLWLIDWEYAAMGDPFFDLATLTSMENFSDTEMHELLHCYLQREPTAVEFRYFYCMRILADTRWALWAYLKANVSPLDEPFEEMGNTFLQHCLERLDYLLRA